MKRKTEAKQKKIEEIEEVEYNESEEDIEELEEENQDSEDDLNVTEETKEFAQRSVYKSKDLDFLTEKLQGQFYHRLNSKKLIKKQGKVPFAEHLSLFGETIVALPENESVHKDLRREL